MMKFGNCIKDFYLYDENYININNGAISLHSKFVYNEVEKTRLNIAKSPFVFNRLEQAKLIRHNANKLAEYIGASGDDIAFTSSTTESINAVLRSFVFLAGDEIVIDSNVYSATRRILEFVCGRAGAMSVNAYLNVPFVSKSEIVDSYRSAITPRTKLVIVEDTVSATGLRMPVKEIVEMCNGKGIQVLVDGTHALGMYDINVPELGADWYVGCCHKWLMSAKGVGYIWAKKENHKSLRSMTISKRHNEGFPRSFDDVGIKDYAGWVTVDVAIEQNKKLGDEARTYCHEMAVWAGDYIAERFNVENIIPSSFVTFMTTIELPSKLQNKSIKVEEIYNKLLDKKIITLINEIDGVKRIRISVAPYNKKEDYEKLCDAVDEIIAEY